MITKDKVTEIFCIIDEFDKNFESELKKNLLPVTYRGVWALMSLAKRQKRTPLPQRCL